MRHPDGVARRARRPKDNVIAISATGDNLGEMRRSVRSVWFLVVPRTGLLDIAGPWEVLGHANEVLGWGAYDLDVVGPSAPSAPTRHGFIVGGIRTLPESTRRLPDVAIVAGGSARHPMPDGETRVAEWLRRHRRRLATVVSICTGAFVLGKAGILDGRRATTHWLHLRDLQARVPAAHVVDDGIFVRDEGVWTSAGITAGVDLALALVEDHHGHDVAIGVAKRLVLFLRRSGNQAQFSSALQRQEKEPPKLRDISAFVVEHIDESLSVDRIAAHVHMSPRSLSRWFRAHLQESPASLVRRLRVDEARRLLETSPLSLRDIAARSGFGDASTMWRAFTQYLGVTPSDYRQRFTHASAP
jgi:transcriptional regulator GlxA family with amidase domain